MFKPIMLAGVFAMAMAAPAFAVPSSPASHPDKSSGITLVRDKHHHSGRSHRHGPRRHYGHRRYSAPPPGWHRYHRRPWDWQRRGCILFGPVWFCP